MLPFLRVEHNPFVVSPTLCGSIISLNASIPYTNKVNEGDYFHSKGILPKQAHKLTIDKAIIEFQELVKRLISKA